MRRTLSVLTEDHPGVLTRLSNLISRRGYNVESLSVARTHRPGLSRFTIVVEADETSSKQMIKQLEKLVEAVEVKDLTHGPFVERRMMLVKVRASPEERHNLLQTAEVFRSRVVDVGSDAVILEVTGDAEKVEALLRTLEPFGVLEMAGSGAVALGRAGFGTAND